MKNVWQTIFALSAAAALLPTAGCGRSDGASTADPSARNQLILRLFESIERRDYEASSQQAVKLRALDPGSIFLSRMVDIQTGNLYVTRAQRKLDAGDYAGAVALVDEAARKNPLYLEMEKELRTARQVAEMARMVADYRAAREHKDRMAAVKTKDDASGGEYIRSLAACGRLLDRIAASARAFNHAPLIKAAARERAAIDRESLAEHRRRTEELAAAKAAREAAEREKAERENPTEAAAPEGNADAPNP